MTRKVCFRYKAYILLLIITIFHHNAFAQQITDLDALHFVADIDTAMPVGNGSTVYSRDSDVMIFDAGSVQVTKTSPLGDLDGVGIDAYHNTGDGCGDSLYSLDATKLIAATAMRSADIFTASGIKILDAQGEGIPDGINVDAVSRDPANCDLLLSIDSTSMLGGTLFRKDDVIRWDSISFSLHMATGLNANIDALHYLATDRLLVSIDVGAALPDLDGKDDEVFEIGNSGGAFQLLAFEPATFSDSWQGADLNALWADPAPQMGTVQWQLDAFTASENNGQLNLILERINGSEQAVQIQLSISSASATLNSDYTINLVASMADGVTTSSVAVSMINDALVEGDEYFTLSISSVTQGASIGNPSQIKVTIRDDEDFIFADGFES